MEKYKCNDCGEIFREDEISYDNGYDMVEYWGSMVQMPWTIEKCPYCGSEDIEEKEDKDESNN
jgi:DNA-directed RNA polymerase subunit RPC12/RpoP